MDTPISEKHKPLISGITTILDLLVQLHYVSPTDVLYSPHTMPNPIIDIVRMQRLGFDNEVIGLVQCLPWLRNEIVWGWQDEGVELIPRSKTVNYFVQPGGSVGDELFDDLRWGDTKRGPNFKILPSWILRLTTGGFNNYGVHILYNVQDRKFLAFDL